MNKLLAAALITLSTNTVAEDVGYKYECYYQTPFQDFPEKEILVIVTGRVESLSELKGKQAIVVEADGEKKTLKVGNCKVEM